MQSKKQVLQFYREMRDEVERALEGIHDMIRSIQLSPQTDYPDESTLTGIQIVVGKTKITR